MYQNIIVPTDFTDPKSTIDLLKKAKQISSNHSIILLHVCELIPSHALNELSDDLIGDVNQNAEKAMIKLSKDSGVKVKTEVRQGRAYKQIIQSAMENESNLILINAHQPEFKDYLIGSTAEKVVLHAPCSVLVSR